MTSPYHLHDGDTPGGPELFADLSPKDIEDWVAMIDDAHAKARNAYCAHGVGEAGQITEYKYLLSDLIRAHSRALIREWSDMFEKVKKERGF